MYTSMYGFYAVIYIHIKTYIICDMHGVTIYEPCSSLDLLFITNTNGSYGKLSACFREAVVIVWELDDGWCILYFTVNKLFILKTIYVSSCFKHILPVKYNGTDDTSVTSI